MEIQDSPFRPSWWGTNLAGVAARPDVGTYGQYEFEALPPVPFDMDGDLEWLARQRPHKVWSIGEEVSVELPTLLASCESKRLVLPPAFIRFMGTPELQLRVRSNTGCFIDLDSAPVGSPDGGHLIRFLADQQGCLFWYLHLVDGGADHAVVCSPDYYGTEAGGTSDADADEICFAAESFEAFLCRFWLENEVWFAGVHKTPMPEAGAEYIRHYLAD